MAKPLTSVLLFSLHLCYTSAMKKLTYLTALCLITATMSFHPIEADTTPPTIIAEAAVLMDADTGQILYEKNSHKTMPPASITKLMTALLVLENLAPEATITFSKNAVMSIEAGSSHIGMREGETITVNDALHGLLLMSANEVANGLAEAVSGSTAAFAEAMNAKALSLGAVNTHFVNAHGLYDVTHYTTAYDMGLITQALLKEDYFLEVMAHYTYQIPTTNLVDEIRYMSQSHKMLNPNKGTTYFRDDAIAGKSGYTVKSGHTLVTVSRQKDTTLIAVILKSDANNLYTDTHKLLNHGFEDFEKITVPATFWTKDLPLEDGHEAHLTLASDTQYLVPKGTQSADIAVTPEIRPMASDANAGDTIGLAILSLGGQPLATSDIVVRAMAASTTAAETTTASAPVTQEQAVPENGGGHLVRNIFLILGGVLVVGFLVLFYLANRKTMSYKDYKAMRDREREQGRRF